MGQGATRFQSNPILTRIVREEGPAGRFKDGGTLHEGQSGSRRFTVRED